MNIQEFADVVDKTLEIRRRQNWGNPNAIWYAYFQGGEIKQGVCLTSSFGDGATPQDALNDYAAGISGKRIVFNASSPGRQEFVVPMLTLEGGGR